LQYRNKPERKEGLLEKDTVGGEFDTVVALKSYLETEEN
jgi:hypothetical protein